MKTLFWAMVLLMVCGCADDGPTTYRPHFGPEAAQQQPAKKTAPTHDVPEMLSSTSESVEKVKDLDFAVYGIPVYPGATIKENSMLSFRAKKDGPKEYQVMFESIDAVPKIAYWFKDQIKPDHAMSSRDLGTLDGTTDKGYPIKISIADIEEKTIISITISEIAKK
ncbi:MAG TPA: hypothetical protein VG820_01545 [Fimbriimonadaceae bacterium]|nr:hypothetical protein [Fimbriimonadaceae bacterium]